MHITLHLGSNFDKNKILYIMLGGFALATLILLAILCIILYKVLPKSFSKESQELGFSTIIVYEYLSQRRKRSNLKYLRAVKQEKL